MAADKSKAVIFGFAIGDALGYPIEFMSLSQIKDRYIPILLPVWQAVSVTHGLGSTLSLKARVNELKRSIIYLICLFGYLIKSLVYE